MGLITCTDTASWCRLCLGEVWPVIDEDVSRVATTHQTPDSRGTQRAAAWWWRWCRVSVSGLAAWRPRVTVCQLIFAQCGDGCWIANTRPSHCNTSSLSDPFVLWRCCHAHTDHLHSQPGASHSVWCQTHIFHSLLWFIVPRISWVRVKVCSLQISFYRLFFDMQPLMSMCVTMRCVRHRLQLYQA